MMVQEIFRAGGPSESTSKSWLRHLIQTYRGQFRDMPSLALPLELDPFEKKGIDRRQPSGCLTGEYGLLSSEHPERQYSQSSRKDADRPNLGLSDRESYRELAQDRRLRHASHNQPRDLFNQNQGVAMATT